MDRILDPANLVPSLNVPVVIIGAGAAGLIAGLAVRELGVKAMVLERDAKPTGNTSLSAGMIPAAGTRFQRARGVVDSADLLADDILAKSHGYADREVVHAVADFSGPTVEWLADNHGVQFSLVEGFLYPGHSQTRMHAPARRTGGELMTALLTSAHINHLEIVTNAKVGELFARPDGEIVGVRMHRPDGTFQDIGCQALILACNGFGGNRELVQRNIPEMASATYFGHPGNQGDAVLWGTELGALFNHMSGYQGHGSVVTELSTLISWAIMMEGGIQVNAAGLRFSNEHLGYSEQAAVVLTQPGGFAWNIYDQRIHEMCMQFESYKNALSAGAILKANSIEELSQVTKLPGQPLAHTLDDCQKMAAVERSDPYERDFSTRPQLGATLYAVRVTGALFHTQGGLVIDIEGVVMRPNGTRFPNLLAAGGAACGLSGPSAAGYLSGNGLLSATVLGRICGYTAARIVLGEAVGGKVATQN